MGGHSLCRSLACDPSFPSPGLRPAFQPAQRVVDGLSIISPQPSIHHQVDMMVMTSLHGLYCVEPPAQRRDAAIAIAGRALSQHLLDGWCQLGPPQWPWLARLPAIIEPAAGHPEGVAGQGNRSVELLGQTYHIPSGDRRSLSSQNFFKMSTSSALRPKARSSSSILRWRVKRRLLGMSSPWSRKP